MANLATKEALHDRVDDAELFAAIDRDLERQGVDRFDPRPTARVGMVLPDLLPITGNVLIPLKETISRFGTMLRLLRPTL